MDTARDATFTGTLQATASRRRALGRLAGGSLAAALMAGGGFRLAAAQSATPAAAGCAGDPKVGSPVSVVGIDGGPIGRITINTVTDPFTAYNPSSPPERGNRYIVLTVTVENSGTNPWQFDPRGIILQDADGFIAQARSIDMGATPAVPRLDGQTLKPGAQAQGAVGYVALKGTQQARVFLMGGDRLILLATLR